ncbi:MAG: hypothetical protein QOH97_4806 [Actinoplanes sp.]|nr:hypothetical protein [Actinoplanes sp.]
MTVRLVIASVAVTALLAGCGDNTQWKEPQSPRPSTAPSTAPPTALPTGTGVEPSAVVSATARPAGCAVFPNDNVWHADISRLPVHPRSAAYVAGMGRAGNLHPDFGAGTIDGAAFGIPVTVVPPGQAGTRVRFDNPDESDRGLYPIPSNVRIEGGDGHIILFDRVRCRSYELYDASRTGAGWHAGSGAVFDLRSNALRPAGWTSADAAGLSILAGLVRYDEVAKGRVDHAIRITVQRSQNAYIWPARHAASSPIDRSLPPMGLRLRLKAGVPISGLPRQARIIAQAMKTYGVIVADNGSSWFFTGTSDDRWDNEQLDALKTLTGADFEAVDESALRTSANSGSAHR